MAEYWSLKDKDILIVEDFPEMRSMLRNTLFSFGARNIREARNGQEAVDALCRQTADLVMCDYNLGKGKDGQQVLEEAKHRRVLPQSSMFVMLTAENTSQMVLGAMEHQPDEYISKPFTKDVLRTRLEKLMARKDALHGIADAAHAGDFAKAIKLCDERLAEGAKNPIELMRLKAEYSLAIGSYEQAGALYQQILAAREFPWAVLGLAISYYHQKEYAKAKPLLEGLLASNAAFVSAHDWLARVHQALGEHAQAQTVLMEAVAKSPKAILRQRALAQACTHNADYAMAERAYQDVVRVGKYSCYKQPEDYTGLADVLCKTKTPKDALKIVLGMKQEFPDDPTALVHAGLAEGALYQTLGQPEDSAKSIAAAVAAFHAQPERANSQVVLQLARACFGQGKADEGKELIKHIVRNHHDNEAMLEQARQILREAGVEGGGEDLINSTRREVVDINNRGVKLTQEGQTEEAITLFVQAAKAMPDNITINLNAAQALIMAMQKGGKHSQRHAAALGYLARVRHADAANEKCRKLLAVCQNLG